VGQYVRDAKNAGLDEVASFFEVMAQDFAGIAGGRTGHPVTKIPLVGPRESACGPVDDRGH